MLINILIFICMIALGILTTLQGTLLKTYSTMTNFPFNKIGIIFTFITIGFFICSNLVGIIAQKISKKLIMLILLFLLLGITIFIPFIKNIYVLLGSLFLLGGTIGSLMSFCSAYMIGLNIEKSNRYLNLIHSFFGLGGVFGPIIVNLFLYLKMPSINIYFYISIFVGILLFCFSIKLPSNDIEINKISINNLKLFFKNKKLILICLGIALYNGSEVGIWGWLSTLSQINSIYIRNLLVSIFWSGMLVGRFGLNFVIEKYSLKKILYILILITIVFCFLISILNTTILIQIIFIFFIGLGCSSICPLMIAIGFICNKDKELNYMLSSILLSSGSFGIMIIPFLMGFFMNSNFSQIIPILSLMMIIFILKFLKIERN